MNYGYLALAVGISIIFWADAADGEDELEIEPAGIVEKLETKIDELTAAVTGTDLENMIPSPQLVAMLKKTEGCSLTRYVDAGGASIGYGHFFANFDDCPPRITQAQAEKYFVEDIEARAAKWVRMYVKIELEQYEFDALCSVAYNMSPRSFKKFAAEVNEGYNMDSIAQESILWVKQQYRSAIARRRRAECVLFNEGNYS